MACKEKAEAKENVILIQIMRQRNGSVLVVSSGIFTVKGKGKRFLGKEDQDIVSLRKDHGHQRRRDHGHQRLAERCSF